MSAPLKTLTILLFAALLGAQCVGSCGTPISIADRNLPPCHRHQPSPVQLTSHLCCHDAILTATDQPAVDTAVPVVVPAGEQTFAPAAIAVVSSSQTPSPPFVLRI